jgi:hypothetical protein
MAYVYHDRDGVLTTKKGIYVISPYEKFNGKASTVPEFVDAIHDDQCELYMVDSEGRLFLDDHDDEVRECDSRIINEMNKKSKWIGFSYTLTWEYTNEDQVVVYNENGECFLIGHNWMIKDLKIPNHVMVKIE